MTMFIFKGNSPDFSNSGKFLVFEVEPELGLAKRTNNVIAETENTEEILH